ncbi:MAG TPA: S8 family serine peptidase [Candidatus Limnocylindrales bacterium]|nr:S8 family serine peptidase [Candidatus Limnocylindrales bacterium]
MSPDGRASPRTFYLNEQHELARTEKKGGGVPPQYLDINWATKASTITRSLARVRTEIQASHDPTNKNHYFLLAAPVPQLSKASKDKRKAHEGRIAENTDFAERHSRVFRRLGIDLLSVADDGSALVHMKPELIEQLSNTAKNLRELGAREKARWATIERFETIPPGLRVDADWLSGLTAKAATDAVVELQPLLTRAEIDSLIRAVVATLAQGLGEAVTGTGTDFSGRQWLRGRITRESLKRISETFYSIQSLHSPLLSIAAASSTPTRDRGRAPRPLEVDTSTLPAIGVLDTGVPANHVTLAQYRRGSYVAPTSPGVPIDPHGCFVSSRIVFGDPDYGMGPPRGVPAGTARFYDINVSGIGPGEIEDKNVFPALQAIVSTAPDVRVFNMSFDTALPLDSLSPVKRSEALILVQDLDNFIFQNDILVVVAAGNSQLGTIPATAYPGHFSAPEWALGPWARSFNSLTCGSLVGRLASGGLVTKPNWPSPFCRVGPGLCQSPKPDFSANGGNCTAQYQYAAGLGVWCISPEGRWEDHLGTSYAAPLLARECAFALQRLQRVCEREAQPFAVTVKAFLALTAIPPVNEEPVRRLAERTLGRGLATAERLDRPSSETGVMIWQGVLEDEKDIARIQIPIPSEWLKNASEPSLRLIVVWDPPVNQAVRHLWSTRNVTATLRTNPEVQALRPLRLKPHGTYPALERLYNLRKLATNVTVQGDTWLLEIAYEQIAEYHAGMSFPPQQRVAFAAEMFDNGAKRLSPQSYLQAMAVTKTMTRLTTPPTAVRLPVILRTPV